MSGSSKDGLVIACVGEGMQTEVVGVVVAGTVVVVTAAKLLVYVALDGMLITVTAATLVATDLESIVVGAAARALEDTATLALVGLATDVVRAVSSIEGLVISARVVGVLTEATAETVAPRDNDGTLTGKTTVGVLSETTEERPVLEETGGTLTGVLVETLLPLVTSTSVSVGVA